MKQEYHSNAVTNVHIRTKIRNSKMTIFELAQKYNTSETTISKWKNRDNLLDKSSKPNKIIYALTPLEQALA